MVRKKKKVEVKIIDRFLNLIIAVLALISLVFAVKLYWPADFKLLKLPQINLKKTQPIKVKSDRVFPADFTSEEKISLALQTDSTSEADKNAWFQTVTKLAQAADGLELLEVNNDCFGRPTVLKIKRDQPIKVTNPGSSETVLGIGEQFWPVPAGSSVLITPTFDVPEGVTSFSYGYGCGRAQAPSGLFLIE